MDSLNLEPHDMIRVELHLIDRQMLIFSSLAHAIDYIGRNRPVVYKMDQIIGDIITPLVTAQESERAYLHPEDGTFGAPEEPNNVVDMISRKPIP